MHVFLVSLVVGSHIAYNEANGTNFAPFKASKEELGRDTVYACMVMRNTFVFIFLLLPFLSSFFFSSSFGLKCGQSADRNEQGIPFCDGTHKKLQEEEKKKILEGLLMEADTIAFKETKPRVQAVFKMLQSEILSAAGDGRFATEVSVHDEWFHSLVNQKLVEDALEAEGVRAFFEAGTWYLDWSKNAA